MIDEHKRHLSALRDGELDAVSTARLLSDVALDPALRDTWRRYQWVGSAIRGEPLVLDHDCLAERVAAALDREPLTIRRRLRSRFAARRVPSERFVLSPIAGMSLAAAAAFVVVFALPALFQGAGTPDPRLASAPPDPESRPELVSRLAQTSAQRWDLDHPGVATKLDRFLVTHQDTASVTGARGMLPYATFVGYDAPR